MSASDKQLATLRKQIDVIDGRIVGLLNARTNLAVSIGRIKHERGDPVFTPKREKEVVRRVAAASRGPLSARQLQPVYREIMSAALCFEGGLRLGWLKEDGDVAPLLARQRFGDGTRLQAFASLDALLQALRKGRVALALVSTQAWQAVPAAARTAPFSTVETIRRSGVKGRFLLIEARRSQ